MMILVILGIGLIVYYMMNSDKSVARYSGGSFGNTNNQQVNPMALLEMRYAKGEIDEETFLKMKATLSN